MKSFYLKVIFLCLFCLLQAPFFAQAQTTYTVGVENLNYFPYYSIDEGEYFGFARAFLDFFAKEKGIKFEYKPLPIKRLWNDFLKEKLDFKFPDHQYWNGDAKKGINIIYSEPVVGYIDGVMVKPDKKNITVDQFKKLGTVSGFTAWDFLDLIKAKKVEVSQNSSFIGLLKQALIGRVDGAYINISVAQHQLETKLKTPNALVFASKLPHTKSAYLTSTIKHPEIIEALNQFLKSHKDQINQIKLNYKVGTVQN
ncbi:MAG: transporter substrate-binding domain-containing protein [Desulfobacteraceae bacterium]|nr:transporter substrate-binding domain-containing protein [Desulfobacteraceae bacterium]